MRAVSKLAVGLLACLVGSAARASGGIRVESSGVTRTIECRGHRVQIDGTNNDVTLLGRCPRVVVNGTGQKVKIERAGFIRVNGVGNTVIWGQALRGDRPRVRASGINNTVHQGKVGAGRPAAGTGTGPDQPAAPPAASAHASAHHGIKHRILLNRVTRTMTCNAGDDVEVAGNQSNLTLRGPCRKVIVLGNHNVLKVEQAAKVEAIGNENHVVWDHGPNGHPPRVANVGRNNTVRRSAR